MADILQRIDAAIDGLCPCGGPPASGSAYCGADCVPNWRGPDTTSHFDGTAMRWRPDAGNELPVVRINPEVLAPMRRSMEAIARSFAGLAAAVAEALRPALAALQKIEAARLPSAPEPDHPLARMNARRTNAVYGPQRQARPPRKLDPRH